MENNIPKIQKDNAADAAQKEKLAREKALAGESRVANILTVLVFCLFIGGFALLHVITPDRIRSESENRELATLPEFSAEALFSGDFGADVKDYLSDQFPLRDMFITIKAATEVAVGRTENGGVMIGRDSLTSRDSFPDTDNPQKNLSAVSLFTEAATKNDLPVIFAAAGRREDVCTSSLPPLYGTAAQDRLWALIDAKGDEVSERGGTYLNLRHALMGHEGEDIYYRTDHHWTTLGAYYAYLEIWDALPDSVKNGNGPRPESFFTKKTVTEEFYGTSHAASGASWISADSITLWRFVGDEELTLTVNVNTDNYTQKGLYFPDFLSVRDKYSVFLGENVARLDITDGTGERPTLVLVKDSFAQCLAPFLAADFDLILIDPRYSTDSVYRIAAEESADAVVILVNAESVTDTADLAKLRAGLPSENN